MPEQTADRRQLGQTGVLISAAILGCGTFGGIGGADLLIGRGLDDAAALATLEEAELLGINVLDTAERYCGGASERVIGHWLRRRGSDAPAPHIATKVAPPQPDQGRRFDRAWIEASLARSLERLGLDRVTFFLSHAPDPETPIEQTLEGFHAVAESGGAAHLGCCNVNATQLRAAIDAAARLGIRSFEWVQNGWSLLRPDDDREVRAICREHGLGYTPFSPLAGGVLTGKYRRNARIPEGTRLALRPEGFDRLLTDPVHDALDHLRETANRGGVDSAALALAWLMTDPDCTAPVVGPSRDAPHLAHLAVALGVTLTSEQREMLRIPFAGAA